MENLIGSVILLLKVTCQKACDNWLLYYHFKPLWIANLPFSLKKKTTVLSIKVWKKMLADFLDLMHATKCKIAFVCKKRFLRIHLHLMPLLPFLHPYFLLRVKVWIHKFCKRGHCCVVETRLWDWAAAWWDFPEDLEKIKGWNLSCNIVGRGKRLLHRGLC